MTISFRAAGLSASPAGLASRSRALLDRALATLADRGAGVDCVDLGALPADALLGRSRAPQVDAALGLVAGADLLLVATPIYRATYAGLLKVFFDLLPAAALAGKVAVPIAVGGSAGHQLALDHGLRPLLASVGAVVVATGVYASTDQFADGRPDPAVLERIDRAVHEAVALIAAIAAIPEPIPNQR